MSKLDDWSPEDSVALREFFSRVPQQKLESILKGLCPAEINSEMILKNDAESIARTASMAAGWNSCINALFELSTRNKGRQVESGYRDMS
jgi:hypothetical protein